MDNLLHVFPLGALHRPRGGHRGSRALDGMRPQRCGRGVEQAPEDFRARRGDQARAGVAGNRRVVEGHLDRSRCQRRVRAETNEGAIDVAATRPGPGFALNAPSSTKNGTLANTRMLAIVVNVAISASRRRHTSLGGFLLIEGPPKRTRDCALDAQRGWEARGVPAGGRLGSGSGDTIRLAWRERSCVASACAKPEGAVGNCVVIVDPWLSPAEDAKRRRRAHGN